MMFTLNDVQIWLFDVHCLLKIKSLVSGIWILVQVDVSPDIWTTCTVVNLIFDSEDDYHKLLGCGNSSGHILFTYDKTPGFKPFFLY